MDSEEKAAVFWDLAAPMMADGSVTKSTMMGHPCLRVHGAFFASLERSTNNLVVKLPADRVIELLESVVAEPFVPAGRRFKEWALIPVCDEAIWRDFLKEARIFVEGKS